MGEGREHREGSCCARATSFMKPSALLMSSSLQTPKPLTCWAETCGGRGEWPEHGQALNPVHSAAHLLDVFMNSPTGAGLGGMSGKGIQGRENGMCKGTEGRK